MHDIAKISYTVVEASKVILSKSETLDSLLFTNVEFLFWSGLWIFSDI
jgi:hypothetical protein